MHSTQPRVMREKMNKVIYILVVSLFLTGCPAMFYGNLKNENVEKLVVIPPHNPENPWIIKGGERVKVIWYQECITVKDGANTLYFSGWPIPEGVVENGIFSSSLNVVYKGNSLFFESAKGELLPVPKVSKCGNA